MEKKPLTFIDRLLARHAHPVSFTFHIIGMMWAGYFLWIGSLTIAILCFIIIVGIGEVVGYLDRFYIFSEENLNQFQQSLIRIYHPLNLVLHVLAFISIYSGLWKHSAPCILIGLTLIPIGYLIPWLKRRKQTGLREMATERNELL